MNYLKAMLLALILSVPTAVVAWGGTGHKIVAAIAEAQLTPSARQAVNAILTGEPDPTLPGVANWADEERERDRSSAPYHFINFTRSSCIYNRETLCPDGQCAVEALKRFVAELRDVRTPPAQRAIALKYVVHIVGDIHQPLHAGFKDDLGANKYQIQWNGQGTNLHAFWDTVMIHDTGLDYRTYATALLRGGTATGSMEPALWAQESCMYVKNAAFYPADHTPDQSYVTTWLPYMNQRLLQAGNRLAALLNSIFEQ